MIPYNNPDGDFPEDYLADKDNGAYGNECPRCKKAFTGHKRRYYCKSCNIQSLKEWIDAATYAQLLEAWRFAPVGDELFQGEVGDYFKEVMLKKKSEEPNPAAISKTVGWEKS